MAPTGKDMPARQSPATAPPKRPGRRVIREWFQALLIAAALALVIRWAAVEPYQIPSGSMEPALTGGDRIFVNKFRYGVRWPLNGFRIPFTQTDLWYAEHRLFRGTEPQRWDIVVFKSPEQGVDKHILVKRIVALPGERVHIKDGAVHINGEPVALPSSMEPIAYTAPPPGSATAMAHAVIDDERHTLVPDNHYLVLGDNSAHSRDGRYFGWLPERNILGPVTMVWWPPNRIHRLP